MYMYLPSHTKSGTKIQCSFESSGFIPRYNGSHAALAKALLTDNVNFPKLNTDTASEHNPINWILFGSMLSTIQSVSADCSSSILTCTTISVEGYVKQKHGGPGALVTYLPNNFITVRSHC